MRNRLSITVIIVLLISCFQAYSQGYDLEVKSIIEQYAPTPKALSQTRYGEVSVNKNTGSLGLEISIGSYIDQDFDIPISLSYNYDGFKPERPSGEAGLGWSLIAGGSITREIVGLDDFETNGYYYADNHYNSSSIYGMGYPISKSLSYPTISGNSDETTSDIYHFSFPGHSGSFIIDNNGNFTTYSTSGEKDTYDISYDNDSFTIRTSDGMEWCFGSNINETSRERLINLNGILEQDANRYTIASGKFPIVTWLLDRITAPDGRRAEFIYTTSRTYKDIPEQDNDDVITTFSGGINNNETITRYKFASLVYTSYLSTIRIRELSNSVKTVASFNWERKNYREINEIPNPVGNYFHYQKMIVTTRRLTGVTLSEDTDTLRTATLTYDDSRRRPLLTAVSIPIYGTWTFEYNLPSGNSNFPGQITKSIDLWGYYNGLSDNSDGWGPPTKLDTLSYNEVLNTFERDPNASYSQIGTIKKITWPTGGSSSINYLSFASDLGRQL